MPYATTQFLLGNRLVQPGEAVELPFGASLEAYRGMVTEDAPPAPAPESDPQPAPKPRRRKHAPDVQTPG